MTAINDFLTSLARSIDSASVFDSETVDAVAKLAAESTAQRYPGTDPKTLMHSVPRQWRDDPLAAATRSEIRAFLQIAGPVLNVGAVDSNTMVRAVATAKQMSRAIAINNARAADQAPTASQQVPIDVSVETEEQVRTKLEGALGDEGFQARVGGRKYYAYTAGLLSRGYNRAALGGLWRSGPVAGFLEVASLPKCTTAGELAYALIEAEAVSQAVRESDFSLAVTGKAGSLSGRSPGSAVFPLTTSLRGERISVGLRVDIDMAKRFGRTASFDDDELGRRLTTLIATARAAFATQRAEGIPPLVISDGYYDSSRQRSEGE